MKRVLLLVGILFFASKFHAQNDISANSDVCSASIVEDRYGSEMHKKANVLAYHVDQKGNQYIAQYENELWSCGDGSGCSFFTLIKLDQQGKRLTSINSKDGSQLSESWRKFFGCFITSIVTDDDGNLYVSGNFGAPNPIFGGKNISAVTAYSNNTFIAQMDPESLEIEWIIHSDNPAYGASRATDLKYYNGYLYVAYHQKADQILKNIDSNDSFTVSGNVGVMKLDLNGHLIDNFYGTTERFDWMKNYQSTFVGIHVSRTYGINPKISINETTGNILLSGITNSNMTFGEQKITVPSINSKDLLYHAIYDSNSKLVGAFPSFVVETRGNIMNSPSTEIDEKNNIYVAISRNTQERNSSSAFPLHIYVPEQFDDQEFKTSYLFKFDSTGQIIGKSDLGFGTSVCSMQFNDDELIIAGTYNDSIFSNAGYGYRDAFLFKMYSDMKRFDIAQFGGIIDDMAYAMTIPDNSDHAYLLLSSGSSLKFNNVVFSDGEGSHFARFSLKSKCTISTEDISRENFAISTKQTIDEIQLIFENKMALQHTLSLYDVSGKFIQKINSRNTTFKLHNIDFKKGIYFIKISSETGLSGTYKWVNIYR